VLNTPRSLWPFCPFPACCPAASDAVCLEGAGHVFSAP
jgi:hypothetical protein